MRGFGIWKIDDGIYDILDEGNSSFYIVEGEDRAAVIDTGISPGQKILPLIRKYTSKPLILVLTHAHIDHWYHMDEFEPSICAIEKFEVGRGRPSRHDGRQGSASRTHPRHPHGYAH